MNWKKNGKLSESKNTKKDEQIIKFPESFPADWHFDNFLFTRKKQSRYSPSPLKLGREKKLISSLLLIGLFPLRNL